jgi:hypothetical protein
MAMNAPCQSEDTCCSNRLLGAFSAEEALAFLRAEAEAEAFRPAEEGARTVRREYQIDTAAVVARSMRDFLQARLDEWR